MRLRLFSLAIVCFTLFVGSARALTITNFSSSENNLSFDYSGFEVLDFIASEFPAGDSWEIADETHYAFATVYNWDLYVSHNGTTSILRIGDTAYGSSFDLRQSFVHGSATDSFVFTGTVAAPDSSAGKWGAFSGSFSAIHSSAVPDSGSTTLFLSSALLIVLGRSVRRRRITSEEPNESH